MTDRHSSDRRPSKRAPARAGRPAGRASAAAGAGSARRWAATVAVCLGVLLIGVDGTVLTVAIPDLQRDLAPSTAQVQWIVDGFAVVMAGTVLAAGALGDKAGRRAAFLIGLLVCALGSAAGALADEPAYVIAARVVMGAGSALVMPATLSIIIDLFPEPGPRRRAIAVWTAIAGIGGLLGPVVGGWLVEHFSWRSGFWMNVPVAAVAIVLTVWLVPESRDDAAAPLDHLGTVLSTAGLSLLVWATVEGPGHGWGSARVIAAFAGAAVLLVLFVAWQARCRAPVLPLGLLRPPRVAFGLAAMALVSFLVFGLMLVFTLYMQSVLGYGALEAGVRCLPASAGMIAGSALALPFMGRIDDRLLIIAGNALLAAALTVVATFTPRTGYQALAVFMVLLGVGAGIVLAASTEMVMSAFPGRHAGLGSALNDVTRQVGLALGIAVQGSILTTASTRRLRRLIGPVPGDADANEILAAAAHRPAAFPAATVTAAEDAFVTGMARCATGGAVALAAITAVAAVLLLRARFSTGAATAVPARKAGLWDLARVRAPMSVRSTRRPDGWHVDLTLALRVRRPALWALTSLSLLAVPWLLKRRSARSSPAPPQRALACLRTLRRRLNDRLTGA
ncbi:MFS transporter [Spirillospora sp. NPDC029432]|uniref:MFS transporter n=1 Tax=Spirillospora sp. NPDC029432 TaxID=3154599 RepID=UPI003453C988